MNTDEKTLIIKHITEATERINTITNKCRYPNIGQRNIYESLHGYPEVIEAIKDLCSLNWINKPILVGGMAVVYWARDRQSGDDTDCMFLTESRLLQRKSTYLEKFRQITPHIIEHKETRTILDLLSLKIINLPDTYLSYIYSNSIIDSGIRIASIEGLILMKLSSGRRNDLVDIEMLLENPKCDLKKISNIINKDHWEVLKILKPYDQLMW